MAESAGSSGARLRLGRPVRGRRRGHRARGGAPEGPTGRDATPAPRPADAFGAPGGFSASAAGRPGAGVRPTRRPEPGRDRGSVGQGRGPRAGAVQPEGPAVQRPAVESARRADAGRRGPEDRSGAGAGQERSVRPAAADRSPVPPAGQAAQRTAQRSSARAFVGPAVRSPDRGTAGAAQRPPGPPQRSPAGGRRHAPRRRRPSRRRPRAVRTSKRAAGNAVGRRAVQRTSPGRTSPGRTSDRSAERPVERAAAWAPQRAAERTPERAAESPVVVPFRVAERRGNTARSGDGSARRARRSWPRRGQVAGRPHRTGPRPAAGRAARAGRAERPSAGRGPWRHLVRLAARPDHRRRAEGRSAGW